MRRLIVMFLLLSGGRLLFCQEIKNKEIPEEIFRTIMEYAENAAEDGSDPQSMVEELTDLFGSLLVSPLNINKASREDFEKLLILSDFQIESILDYRTEYGALFSMNELYQIPGLDSKLVTLLTFFFIVSQGDSSPEFNLKSLIAGGKTQLLLRGKGVIEKQQGYSPVTKEDFEKNPDCRYLGSPGLVYTQLKYEYADRLQVAVTIEKDSGEKGVDYKSLNITVNNTGPVERVVIGDFTAHFGQGLVVWNSFSISSNMEPNSFRKPQGGIAPYNSTDENLSFRGIAATINIKKLKVTIMGSHRAYDARLEDGVYTSLIKTGLHNTTTTLERKGSLIGSVLGANLTFSGNKIRISGSSLLYKHNLAYGGRDSLKLEKDRILNGYGGNFGADFYWVLNKVRIFGEAAADHTGSMAGIVGFLYSPYYKLMTAILFRSYSKDYYAPFAGAVSKSGNTNDELGVKCSVTYLAGKYWRLSSSVEILKTYHYLSFTGNFSKETGFGCYFKLLQSQKRASLRYNISYPVTNLIQFVNRLDVNTFGEGKTWLGVHLFHEAIYKSKSKKMDTSFRIAVFSAPIWDVRIYSYERDILYGFSLPVYYGKGIRWYFNLHFSPLKSVDVWFKISQTHYLDRDIIGEGLDLITGPSKSEAKLQLRWRF